MEHTDESVLVINWLSYFGSGWHTTGDALLSHTPAAMVREQACIGRQEIGHEIGINRLAGTPAE